MIRRLLPWLVVLALVVAGYALRTPLAEWATATWARMTGKSAAPELGPLIVSGTIEARDLSVAARAGGRIAALQVMEGQQVKAGDLVAMLDTALLNAKVAEAAAAVEVAKARVELLRAGAREADLEVARAGVRQAEAAAAAAHTAAADAEALVSATGELDVEMARATGALQVANEQVRAAEATARAADLEQQLWERIVGRLEGGADVSLPPELGGGVQHVDAPAERLADARLQWNLRSQATWAAHAKHLAASAGAEAARQALSDLQGRKADPIQLRGQASSAAAAAAVAEAAVEAAHANLAVVEAGATAEQIASSEAAVAQAQAAQAALEATRSQYEVRAPQEGIITQLVLKEGEVAAPGAVVARLADRREVTVTVYVPEPRLGEVRAGQPAAISVDAFPGRSFPATVRTIATEAEFTPKNVLSRDERANTVYAVTLAAPNGDGDLKPGMPADAAFCDASQPCAFPFAAQQSSDAAGTSGITAALDRVLRKATPTGLAEPPVEDGDARAPAGGRYAGAIEASMVAVAAETGGRAIAVRGVEGEPVVAGQVLVTLDATEVVAQRAQAEAAVAAAEAELARVRAPAQAERVAQAVAVVRQAEAGAGAAQARLDAAEAQRERPQELDSEINAARQHVKVATAAVDSAQAAVKTAQVLQESLPNPGSDENKTRRAVYDAQAEAAAASLRAAQAQVSGAQATLAQLLAIRRAPVALDAAVHAAEGAVRLSQADAAAARARLAQVEAPPQKAQVALADAGVGQARAALATADVALAKLEVRSPLAGQVVTQGIHAGEVVNPGTTLYTVADLGTVHLQVYVPVSELGAVRLGQDARVVADAYPGRTFTGTITRIGEQAEYTPQNVQTSDERARLVVAVEVTLPNPDGALRPGMAAEASW